MENNERKPVQPAPKPIERSADQPSPARNPADKAAPTDSEREREWGPQPVVTSPTKSARELGPMDQPDEEP